jgi:hypothetical protein
VRNPTDRAHWRALELPGRTGDNAPSAEWLARTYWRSLARSVAGATRAEGEPLGPLRLRIGRRGPVLLAFGPAEVHREGEALELRFPIVGGLAASRPGGTLELVLRPGAAGVVVRGYAPRLAGRRGALRPVGALYELGQRGVHAAVTRGYLRRLERELGAGAEATR